MENAVGASKVGVGHGVTGIYRIHRVIQWHGIRNCGKAGAILIRRFYQRVSIKL